MVRIVQLLCPQRHCLMACAYEPDGAGNGKPSSFEEAKDALMEMIGPNGPVNNWCALCGSRALHCEEGETKFATLNEALPSLMQNQAAQMQGRAYLERTGQMFEKRQKN